MKKVLIAGLVAFSLVLIGGSAMAWHIDSDIDVVDAGVYVEAGHTDNDWNYFATVAGVDGTGAINIHGGEPGHFLGIDSGLGTMVCVQDGSGHASQYMAVSGCLPECCVCDDEQCGFCPEYGYKANAYATVDGQGMIAIASVEGLGRDCTKCCFGGEYNGQGLYTKGNGDFTAGMSSTRWIETSEGVWDSDSHAMGAYGENVHFKAYGIQGMAVGDGENAGMFHAEMCFHDDGCGPVCEC